MDRHSNEMGLVEKYKNSLGKIAKIVNSIAFSPDLPPFFKKVLDTPLYMAYK
jgi:hypothetical protein